MRRPGHAGLPAHADGSRLRELCEGAVLSAPGLAEVRLDPLALALWELCDGTTTLTEIQEAVVGLFSAEPAALRAEVDRCLDDLTAAGLLQWKEAGA